MTIFGSTRVNLNTVISRVGWDEIEPFENGSSRPFIPSCYTVLKCQTLYTDIFLRKTFTSRSDVIINVYYCGLNINTCDERKKVCSSGWNPETLKYPLRSPVANLTIVIYNTCRQFYWAYSVVGQHPFLLST